MNSVPMILQPVDVMRTGLGLSDIKSNITPAHPVQLIQSQADPKLAETQKVILSKVYGSHVPLRMMMEESILSQFQRLPGLTSSFTGLETLLKRDTKIDYVDYLGGQENSEKQIDVHSLMESRLGDKPF